MKEQAPKTKPLVTYSIEERKAFLAQGMSEEEINAMELRKNALLRNSLEKRLRDRAMKALEKDFEKSSGG